MTLSVREVYLYNLDSSNSPAFDLAEVEERGAVVVGRKGNEAVAKQLKNSTAIPGRLVLCYWLYGQAEGNTTGVWPSGDSRNSAGPTFTPRQNQPFYKSGDWQNVLNAHNDYFLYNSAGQRLYEAVGSRYSYHLDLTNTALQDLILARLSDYMTANASSWTGWFVDNIIVNYGKLTIEAVNKDGTVNIWRAGSRTALSEASYRAGVASFLQRLQAAAHAISHTFGGNLITAAATNNAWDQYLPYLDTALDEVSSLKDAANGGFSSSTLTRKLTQWGTALAGGTKLSLVMRDGGAIGSDPAPTADAYASAMVALYFLLADASDLLTLRITNKGYYSADWRQYTIYATAFGAPSGAASLKPDGVTWRRDFDNGYVELTPGSTPSAQIVVSETVPTPTPVQSPASPTGLTTNVSGSQVALSWSAVSGATSYLVERSSDAGASWQPVAQPTTTSATDTAPTGTQQYRVSAVNSAGPSAPSTTSSANVVSGATVESVACIFVNEGFADEVLIGAGTKLFRSQQGGASPVKIQDFGSANYVLDAQSSPVNPNEIGVAVGSTAQRSFDGGQTWSTFITGATGSQARMLASAPWGHACVFVQTSNPADALKFEEGSSVDWSAVASPPNELLSITPMRTTAGFVCGDAFGNFYKLLKQGEANSYVATKFSNIGATTAIRDGIRDGALDGLAFWATSAGTYKTLNNDTAYLVRATPAYQIGYGPLGPVPPLPPAPVTLELLAIGPVGGSATIRSWTQAGGWTSISTPDPTLTYKEVIASPLDPNRLAITNEGRVWESTNHGATWTEITIAKEAGATINYLRLAYTATGVLCIWGMVAGHIVDGFGRPLSQLRVWRAGAILATLTDYAYLGDSNIPYCAIGGLGDDLIVTGQAINGGGGPSGIVMLWIDTAAASPTFHTIAGPFADTPRYVWQVARAPGGRRLIAWGDQSATSTLYSATDYRVTQTLGTLATISGGIVAAAWTAGGIVVASGTNLVAVNPDTGAIDTLSSAVVGGVQVAAQSTQQMWATRTVGAGADSYVVNDGSASGTAPASGILYGGAGGGGSRTFAVLQRGGG